MSSSIARGLLGACCVAIAACAPPDEQGLEPGATQAEELGELRGFIRAQKPIHGQYIVVFDESAPGVSPENAAEIAQEMTLRNGGRVLQVYKHVFQGYLAEMNSQAAQRIARNPRVRLVAEDEEVELTSVQQNATWGLDRIDERSLPLNQAYQQSATGQGVNVYVMDSGMLRTHNEFAGRLGRAVTFINDGRGATDCNGHGTHVAGTIGGATYGVAKGVTLHTVRVLGCTGSGAWSGIIGGVDWVTGNHVKPAVVNMSLGGGGYALLDEAVRRSIAAGITYVIAAGNDNKDACTVSPARVAEAITVGATDSSDNRSWFSNWGGCVDLFAPGSAITSAWHTSSTATHTIDGTSMATPHVAGVAALYLQRNPTATPAQVAQSLTDASTRNVVGGELNGSPNRLLYSLFVQGEPRFLGPSLWTQAYSNAEGWGNSDSYYETFMTGDLNGDGLQDMCARGPQGVQCSLSNGNGFEEATLWQSALSDAAGWASHPSYWGTLQLADTNGDGRADLCVRASTGIGCALSLGTHFGPMYLWSSSFNNTENTDSHPSYWKTLRFPDVNGDGKADICGRGPAGMMCGLSTGSSFSTPTNWAPILADTYGWQGSPAYWGTIQFPDVNGDKRADVCFRASNGIGCAVSTGSTFGTMYLWLNDFGDAQGWSAKAAYYQTIQFPDIDGDGRADVCGRGLRGVLCAKSTGSNFGGVLTNWASAYSDEAGWASYESYWGTLRFPDINGDGKADVCGRNGAGIQCGVSDGNSFGVASSWTTKYSNAGGWGSSPSYWKTLRFVDLNQDGRVDLCGRGIAGLICALSSL